MVSFIPPHLRPAPYAARRVSSRVAGRGSITIYAIFLIPLILALLSLAVDFGRMELIKTELQRDADMTARGTLLMYVSDGAATAQTVGPVMATNKYNPVDANSGIQPNVSLVWGWWNASTKTFTAGTGTPMAVQVTISRTKQFGNPVPLTFPLLNGASGVLQTCDVWATATAVLQPSQTTTTTVPGTADIWLSGMPLLSNASWSDNPLNAAPVLALNVTPGSILSFGSTGSTMYNGTTCNISSDGMTSNVVTHMASSPDGNHNGLQNGIQTLSAPQNALIGVFLTNAQPDTVTPPATSLTYSTTASMNQKNNVGLQTQQPFFIGDGQVNSGGAQAFLVPAGATKLYLGVFDGFQNCDNPGTLSVTITNKAKVYLVK